MTSEQLEAGILRSSDFDILVLPDNVPHCGAIDKVLEWLQQGNCLVLFDSAFTFGLYAGLLFEELAGKLPDDYAGEYWDYDSSDSTVIWKATRITEGLAVGEKYLAESGDARLFAGKLPSNAYILGVDAQDPDKATIVLFRGKGTVLFIGPDAEVVHFSQLLGNAMLYVRDEEKAVEEISLAIASKGYDWEARTTSVSGLPKEDEKRLCGAKTEDAYSSASSTSMDSTLSVVWATAGAGGSLPSSVDWRNFQGSDWTTPIRSQGLCGSCVAHASLAVFESLLEIAAYAPNEDPNLSENRLFFCGCGRCCDSGWYLSKAAEFLRDTGVPDEPCWPYKPYDVSCRGYCSDCAQRSLKIDSFRRLTSIEEMKRSLVENGPLLGRMDVYEDFFYYWGGIYRHAWGERRGGHAVAIVGFDDTEGCWIVKNSWGRWWGKQGWARIGYGEVGIEKYSYELKVKTVPSCQSWDKTFGGSDYDWGISVQQTQDGGYIVLGYTESYSAGDYDFWLIKTDAQGNKQWDRTFGGSDCDWGISVQQTQDGGYIVLGYTASYGAGDYDFWLIKTDAQGNKQWDRTFGGSSRDMGDSVQQTADGGYIVLGYTKSYGAGKADVWLIKTDTHGNRQWNRTFGGSDSDGGISVQQTTDGGYIVLGSTRSYGAGLNDVWLIKTDAQGNKQWERTFGGSEDDRGYSVQQASDGGYILLGSTQSYGAGRIDIWLIKTDTHGNRQWDRTFGGSGSAYDSGRSVQQTEDGGYILLGCTASYGAGGLDFWLIKYCPEE